MKKNTLFNTLYWLSLMFRAGLILLFVYYLTPIITGIHITSFYQIVAGFFIILASLLAIFGRNK
jgi:hypothetical protein